MKMINTYNRNIKLIDSNYEYCHPIVNAVALRSVAIGFTSFAERHLHYARGAQRVLACEGSGVITISQLLLDLRFFLNLAVPHP